LSNKVGGWLSRSWVSQCARYVGFLGQSRPLTYNVKTTHGLSSPTLGANINAASSSSVILPYDITEGPVLPMQEESTHQRQLEQLRVQGRLEYPLVFDNSRWTPLTKSARSVMTPSADVTVELSTKNKFFGALVKPCVSIVSHRAFGFQLHRNQLLM